MRLVRECKEYLALRSTNGALSQADIMVQNQQKLLLRIEELEDLIVDLKQQ